MEEMFSPFFSIFMLFGVLPVPRSSIPFVAGNSLSAQLVHKPFASLQPG